MTHTSGAEIALSMMEASGICMRPEILFITFPICLPHAGDPPPLPVKSMIPFGVAMLATMTKARGIDVALLDGEALQLRPEEIVEVVGRMSPSAVGFSICSPSVRMARKVLDDLVEMDCICFAGGPHISAEKEQCRDEFPGMAAYFTGESESAWSVLLDRLLACGRRMTADLFEGIEGVITRRTIRVKAPRIVADLDTLPVLDRAMFVNDPIATWKGRVASVLSSRGCPGRCGYCSPLGIRHGAFRTRSIRHLVDEIETLAGMGVHYLQFGDDTFTAVPERMKRFRIELESRRIAIRWLAFSRVEALTEAAVEDMRASGCYKLFLGIESGTERVLRLMNKQQSLEQVSRGVETLRRHGIRTGGLFMLGYPGETLAEIETTVCFARGLGLDDAAFNAVRAYPDTRLFEDCVDAGVGRAALLEYRELIPQIESIFLTREQVAAKRALEDSGVFRIENAMKYNLVNGAQIGTLTAGEMGEVILDAYASFYYRKDYVEQALRQRILVGKENGEEHS